MRSRDPLAGLSVFARIGETLSFTRAAEHLGISRATASAQLRDLERRLGVRLLHRNTRSVTLTEAGKAYLESLRVVLPQLAAAEEEVMAIQKEHVGRIKLSAPPDLGKLYIAPLIGDFLKVHPGINIQMDLSLEIVDLVGRGVDLAIRSTLSSAPNTIVRRIGGSPLVACASRDYLKLSKPINLPTDLKEHSVLHFSPLRWGRVWSFEKGNVHERIEVVPRFEANDSESLKTAALRGAGVALLPQYLVKQELHVGALERVLGDWSANELEINAVFPASRHIAAKVRALVSFLTNGLRPSLKISA